MLDLRCVPVVTDDNVNIFSKVISSFVYLLISPPIGSQKYHDVLEFTALHLYFEAALILRVLS